MNRITQHFDELEFIEALERTGAVRIEAVPHSLPPLVAVGDIGAYAPPEPPEFDCAHNVAGVGTLRDEAPPAEPPRGDGVAGCCWCVALGIVAWVALLALLVRE